jgi:AcrR family transcriptional regulator
MPSRSTSKETRKARTAARRSRLPDKMGIPQNGHTIRSRAVPRRPLQERGRVRYEALLDAAEALLSERDLDDIGYYEIVKRAGMPAASAYHFFPTKSAIFMALAERYFEHFVLDATRIPRKAWPHWQDLLTTMHRRAAAYYNGHKAAMKLILGAQPFLELQQADSSTNHKISAQILETLRAIYELPFIKDAERRFLVAIAISDGIWRSSFSEFGRITPEYQAEGVRAVVAYMRTFLPEHLEPRKADQG